MKGYNEITHNGLTLVRLYNTIVLEESDTKLVLRTGGWITASTAKAINKAIQHGKVFRRKGTMYWTDGVVELPIPSDKLEVIK